MALPNTWMEVVQILRLAAKLLQDVNIKTLKIGFVQLWSTRATRLGIYSLQAYNYSVEVYKAATLIYPHITFIDVATTYFTNVPKKRNHNVTGSLHFYVRMDVPMQRKAAVRERCSNVLST